MYIGFAASCSNSYAPKQQLRFHRWAGLCLLEQPSLKLATRDGLACNTFQYFQDAYEDTRWQTAYVA